MRGINVDGTAAKSIKIGDSMDMNLSSWSEHGGIAEGFARPASDAPKGNRALIITARGGVQGHPIGGDYMEAEWISDGRFTVTGVRHGAILPAFGQTREVPATFIEVTQTAVFAPPDLVGTP